MLRPIAIAVLLCASAAHADDDDDRFNGSTVRRNGARIGTVDGNRIRFESGERARIDGDRVRYSNGSSARIDAMGRIRNDMAFGEPPRLDLSTSSTPSTLFPSHDAGGSLFRADWDRAAKAQQQRQREWFWEESRRQRRQTESTQPEAPQYQYAQTQYPQYPEYSYYQYWVPPHWSDPVLDPYDFILDPYSASPFAAPAKLPKE